MKKTCLVLVIIIILAVFAACNDKAATESSLEIYIVSGDLPDSENIDIDSLKLKETPILTLKDIQKYYWEEQTFIMKKDLLAERLNVQPGELSVPVNGLPYVVVVNGERIYLGKFWTLLSSLLAPFEPLIYIEGTVGKDYGQYDLQSDQQLYAVSWIEISNDDNYNILYAQVMQSIFDERIHDALKEAGVLAETDEQ